MRGPRTWWIVHALFHNPGSDAFPGINAFRLLSSQVDSLYAIPVGDSNMLGLTCPVSRRSTFDIDCPREAYRDHFSNSGPPEPQDQSSIVLFLLPLASCTPSGDVSTTQSLTLTFADKTTQCPFSYIRILPRMRSLSLFIFLSLEIDLYECSLRTTTLLSLSYSAALAFLSRRI